MTQGFMKEVILIMKTIQLTFEDRLHRRAKTMAFSTGLTFSDFIRVAVGDQLCRLEARLGRAPTMKTRKGRRP